ncbi:excinuclease ABC subunit UvrC [Alkaliphilus sp. MSJ-5]|uniref:UvrABC system protein C n=1 Tax=Alkaliphilus flagellatus TaxID=2841507 RepID=A0ABS6FXP3_9FIRM|nr:excinuclease ABC subunit UvrC [Alkaliphilus flagellatus]MBU5675005.1 excinuclease ABC subunit UvrC [Alkaliphilus flagellatus]
MFDIKEKLKTLPDKPGVYMMRNEKQEIIYVGKAISLKNRVRQYFQSSKNHPPKVRAMVSHINTFEYIVTDTELEALILECNLIKENRPKYNVLLRDDKTYPYIKVTINEEYPRVIKTRKVIKDKAKYFGPYTNIGALNETLEVIHNLYPIRTCSKNIERMIENKERPCLNYHIKKCIGPCTGLVNKEEYMHIVQEIIMFLDGKEDELIRKIEEKMKEAASAMDFEKAAKYRDQVIALNSIIEKQKIVSTNEQDQDVIAMAQGENDSWIQVFFIRKGKLVKREHFILKNTEQDSKQEIVSSFLKQFYSGTTFIPKEILIEEHVEDLEVLEEWLTNKRGNRVNLKVPQKGEKKELLDMVKKNAFMTMEQATTINQLEKERTEDTLQELGDLLCLDEAPYRIESYDISNIQGVESVGSMVVFEGGKSKNRDYRRFKIKTVKGPNDYASLEEIITRRFKRGLEETQDIINQSIEMTEGKFAIFPDLIMVDGGFGQVTSVKKALDSLKLSIPVCGMIKDERHRTKGLVYEGKEVYIEKTSNLFRLITKIQDEVHRFAITYHRSLRKKNTLSSILEEIPGIGETRRKSLMAHFESIDKIRNATIEELLEVKGMNRQVAENIIQFFKK